MNKAMKFECYETLVKNLQEIELLAQVADLSLGNSEATGRIQGNAITRAGLVLLSGYFEGFIRDLAEEYIEILSEEVTVDRYPDQVFCAMLEGIMVDLRPKNGAGADQIKTAIKDSTHIKINRKHFPKTGGNPSVDNIESVFNGLGLPLIIDELSIAHYPIDSTFVEESQVEPKMRNKIDELIVARIGEPSAEMHSDFVKLIEEKWAAKKKRRKVGYVNEIEQLLKKRNRIAHGEGYEQITPTELREFLKIIQKLAEGLHTKTALLLDSLTST